MVHRICLVDFNMYFVALDEELRQELEWAAAKRPESLAQGQVPDLTDLQAFEKALT